MTMMIAKNWKETLEEELQKPYIAQLKRFIEEEISRGKNIYPPVNEIFKAFSYTPYETTKVVIIGQDPYHGPNQAEGLCFSVKKGQKIPPSLKNIYKEIHSDLGLPIPNHGSLVSWAQQGVLLLNATLTVVEGSPKSHYGKGWEQFTDAVVKKLIDREDPLIFLLWGNSAHQKGGMIESCSQHHVVLKSAHPSPFSAHNFFGCAHFSKTNEILRDWGKEPINWEVS